MDANRLEQLVQRLAASCGRPRFVVTAALLAMVATASVTAIYRHPNLDEGCFSSAAYNLAKEGFLGTTVVEPTWLHTPHIEQHTYWVMPLYLVGQAGWYVIGPENLFWTRAFTILWAVVAVLCFYRICEKLLKDRRVVLLSTALLALNYHFLDNAGYGRPDIMCLALGLAALASYLCLRMRNLAASLAAATALVSLSILTHPNGILHFVGLVLVVLCYERPRLSWAHLAAAAAPPLVAIGLWSIYILQDPHAFSAQLLSNAHGRYRGGWNPLTIVWNEISERYLFSYGITSAASLLGAFKSIFLLSIAAAIGSPCLVKQLRSQKGTRLFLYLWGAYFAMQCVFNLKLTEYLVHINPWCSGLFGILIVWLWDSAVSLRPATMAWAALVLVLSPAGILLKSVQRSYRSAMDPAIAFLSDSTPGASLIFGSASLLYALHYDRRLLDDPYLGVRSGKNGDALIIDQAYEERYRAWVTERPEDYSKIMAALAQYQKVYDRFGYKIYLRVP